jgi:SAM-dependent methyltransferase
MNELDDPGRYEEIGRLVRGKPVLKALYREVYDEYLACVARCPPTGGVLEIGSGAGFARDIIPGLITSDILAYPGLGAVFDARRLPFGAATLRTIVLFNVFHHIPDSAAFLAECERVLRPGGRVLIVDPHPGVVCGPILRFLHHEPYDRGLGWTFESSGPLSGANTAQCWIVFRRDRALFERRFPRLSIVRYQPVSPFRYWLSGGLRWWTLLPRALFGAATALDRRLVAAWPDTGSFAHVELVRRSD